MTVMRKILANLDRMSPADREIGQFIVENPDRMLGLSSAALAAEAGRSQSSVVKFAQRLGYASYQDLKLAVNTTRAQEWRVPGGPIHGSIEKGDGFSAIFEKLLASKVLAMRETMAANTGHEVRQAVAALTGARRIYLAGVGAPSLVVSDLSFKLLKIGYAVIHNVDAHVQLANVAGMTARDVLLAVSYSGTSLETLRIAEHAKKQGARVIAITGMRDNPLARLAGVLVHTVADEDQVRSSSITARDAQLAITDLIFLMMVQGRDDANAFIQASEAAVAALKADTPS